MIIINTEQKVSNADMHDDMDKCVLNVTVNRKKHRFESTRDGGEWFVKTSVGKVRVLYSPVAQLNINGNTYDGDLWMLEDVAN